MSLIYERSGRALEYAALACNIYRGCDHACEYCYAPAATHRAAADFRQPAVCDGFLEKLQCEAKRIQPTQPILLCFTCDPYQNLDERLGVTRETIKILHGAGHAVNILTKGGSRSLRDADLLGKRDAFATTLTLLDDNVSFQWEPGTALPGDRIATIREYHRLGVPYVGELGARAGSRGGASDHPAYPYLVDLFKVGKLNYHPAAKQIDWAKLATEAKSLLESLHKRYYIKRDLACYLANN